MTGKQGPNTKSGKANSSVNSTVHGLRSNNIATIEQKLIYDSFLKELVDYYQPQSPLEKLELERIATCKAKLQTLYALENAKMTVMLKEFTSSPEKLLTHYRGFTPLVKGMLFEFIRWKELVLPCNLTPETLEKIHHEIQSFSGEISDENHLKKVFPDLLHYLLSFDSENDELDQRLMAVSEKLMHAMERGENYCEYLLSIKAFYLDEVEDGVSEDEIDFEEQIKILQEQSKERHGLRKLNINLVQKSFTDPKHLQVVLKPFTELFIAYQTAINSVESVKNFIKEKQASLSLPQQEADLLLRYQTTWERRLSTSIGEFLRLHEMSQTNSAKMMK